jgi:SP family arabinose:H+ symporter-like MFS transporter
LANKINRVFLQSICAGALGGLLFGFDTAVIAGTTDSLRTLFNLTPGQLGFTVSSVLWGTVIGSMTAGMMGERLGGRESLRILAGFYAISALGCAFAPNWTFLLVARFIGGLGIGGSSVLGPVYLAEIAPAKWRGRLVGSFQINIVLGVLAAYLSNYLIGRANLGSAEWRWQFGVAAGPALLFLLLLFGIPPSARWLATKGRVQEAANVLRQLGSDSPDAELAEIVKSIGQTGQADAEPLFKPKYRRPIFLAVSIAMFNQLSGINAITYYLNDIFSMAGFSKMSSSLQAVAFGAMNLTATLLGMSLIDRLGRKTLLLFGSVGMVLTLSGIAAVLLGRAPRGTLLYLLIGYIFFFAISQGAVIWVYLSEVFPNRVRAKGQSLGSSTHWVMNALISGFFPLMATRSGAYPFAFFAVMVALQFFVVLFCFPETKGFTLEEIEHRLGIESQEPIRRT